MWYTEIKTIGGVVVFFRGVREKEFWDRVEWRHAKLPLNAGLMHELRQFRKGQIIGAEKRGVSGDGGGVVSAVATLHLRMVGLARVGAIG